MLKNNKTITLRNAQSLLRSQNEGLIMDSLTSGPKCCSDLARLHSLSNTAVKICIVELVSTGLVVKDKDISSTIHIGRHPIEYMINPAFGVLCAIALGTRDTEVLFYDLAGNIVSEKHIYSEGTITKNTLANIKDAVLSLSNALPPNIKLRNITVSTPGKIDSDGHYFFARHIDDYSSIDYVSYFSSFGVPVKVYRDTNLACLGERNGKLIKPTDKNVYYAYIDYEAGGSLFLESGLYLGSHGFAGECSSYTNSDAVAASSSKGHYKTLEEIETEVGEGHIGVDALRSRAEEGDHKVIEAITLAAKEDALELLAISNLLDVDAIILGGPITKLGPVFNDAIVKYFKEFDANRGECSLRISLSTNPASIGALIQGRNDLLVTEFALLAKNRREKKAKKKKK